MQLKTQSLRRHLRSCTSMKKEAAAAGVVLLLMLLELSACEYVTCDL
jgi:hypothetical protein